MESVFFSDSEWEVGAVLSLSCLLYDKLSSLLLRFT